MENTLSSMSFFFFLYSLSFAAFFCIECDNDGARTVCCFFFFAMRTGKKNEIHRARENTLPKQLLPYCCCCCSYFIQSVRLYSLKIVLELILTNRDIV